MEDPIVDCEIANLSVTSREEARILIEKLSFSVLSAFAGNCAETSVGVA